MEGNSVEQGGSLQRDKLTRTLPRRQPAPKPRQELHSLPTRDSQNSQIQASQSIDIEDSVFAEPVANSTNHVGLNSENVAKPVVEKKVRTLANNHALQKLWGKSATKPVNANQPLNSKTEKTESKKKVMNVNGNEGSVATMEESDSKKENPNGITEIETVDNSPPTSLDKPRESSPTNRPNSDKADKLDKESQNKIKESDKVQAASKRVLVLASKGEWASLEQSLRILETFQSKASDSVLPLAQIQDPANGYTPLMYAVKDNRIQLVDRLIDLGCEPHAKTKDGLSVLHIAILHAREDLIKMLILRKTDLNGVGGVKDQTVFHMAASRPWGIAASLLKLLSIAGSRDYRLTKDKDGWLPLMVAVENGNVPAAKELLSVNCDEQIRTTTSPSGDTCLHLAVRRREVNSQNARLDMVRFLTECGAPIDAQNAEGQTVLHIAASEGDEAMVKYLHVLHANPNIADKEDRTPVLLAAERGKTGVVDILIEKFRASFMERTKNGSTLLHVASMHGHPETALGLLRKGVPLHMPDKSGARSIHIAAKRGHVGVVQALVQKGEQVDASTNDNYTALHVAVQAGKAAVVECLLGLGAQVHIRAGKAQETPLHIASRIGEAGERCAQMLLKSGADPNLCTVEGDAPLHVATKCGNIEVVKLLLADGADPLLQNQDGETPLHLACRACHLSVVQQLCDFVLKKHNAEFMAHFINIRNKQGETALHAASQVCREKGQAAQDRAITQLLLQNGADVSYSTLTTMETPLHYCAAEGNTGVLTVLLQSIRTRDLQRIVNKQNVSGRSPLLLAAKHGHLQAVLLLLQNQARADIFDVEGFSALHLAAQSGHTSVCHELISHKAFVNSKSRVGITPLHLAAMQGYTDLCKSLVMTHNAAVDSLTLKKETPLHLAAAEGQLSVCSLLLELKADPEATDEFGRTPIHLATEKNHSAVVILFLKHQPSLVLGANKDGNTCAHIAAMQGSVSVAKELMKFNQHVVVAARNRANDATPLHLAAEGGHAELVKILLEAGASATDENKAGYNALTLAAKNGHNSVIEVLRSVNEDLLKQASRRTGLTALHVAACHGQPESVRELLVHIPAGVRSEAPTSLAGNQILRQLEGESGLTPLHMAAFSGDENVVRLLLNSPGVIVDFPSTQNGYIPLHLACRKGHAGVAGLLLSRATSLLMVTDRHGRTSLHGAATHGHDRIVELLLGQGADINAADRDGWTALHFSAKAGHASTVKLLLESGASPKSKTTIGRIPLWYAVAEGHNEVLTILLRKEHDSYALMEDRKFVYNLMLCGKATNHEPLQCFILESPAPVDVAAKLSYILASLSFKEKERTKDLLEASKFCEAMATELLALAASAESASRLLTAVDRRQVPLLDVLIEHEQKEVISHPSVQRYLQDLWLGGLHWSSWRLMLLFLSCVLIPPIWLVLSLPLRHNYDKIPVIRFMAHLTSHVYLMALLVMTSTLPICPVIRTSLWPCWYEWLLLAWLSGNMLSELANPRDRNGLGWLRIAVLITAAIAVLVHVAAFFSPTSDWPASMFIRNQFLAIGLLFSCILLLDFMSFHYLFGPWAIIIGSLMADAGRFLIILAIFMFGFSMHMSALNQPFSASNSTLTASKTVTQGLPSGVIVTPLDTFEMLFFALFGLTSIRDIQIETDQPEWTTFLFKIVFGVYMLMTTVVLINLLIAMMSDTYQRIQAQSDIEWKYGLAKLVRSMHRTADTPSPLNLFSSWITYLVGLCKNKNMDQSTANERIKTCEVRETNNNRTWFTKLRHKARVAPQNSLQINHHMHPLSSQVSLSADRRTIEHVTDWKLIVKRYLTLIGKRIGNDSDAC